MALRISLDTQVFRYAMMLFSPCLENALFSLNSFHCSTQTDMSWAAMELVSSSGFKADATPLSSGAQGPPTPPPATAPAPSGFDSFFA